MSKEHKQYTKQFKLDAIALYETSGKTAAEIERDLGLPAKRLHQWRWQLKQTQRQEPDSYRQALEAENKRLKRELEVARQERDILKGAVVFFTKEQS